MPYHYFDAGLAKKYGTDYAIILTYLWENVKRSIANESNRHEDLYWAKDSKNALAALFPYYTTDRIVFIFGKLAENNLIFFKYSPKNAAEIWYTLTPQTIKYFTHGTPPATKPKPKKNVNLQKFSEITRADAEGKDAYFILAYKFWLIWIKDNPKSYTLTTANVNKWTDAVKKIVETDKQDLRRLIGVYVYFKNCANNEAGFDRFWFDTIKSISALRKKNKDDVYYLDRIIDKVNKKIEQSDQFYKDIIAEEQKIINP